MVDNGYVCWQQIAWLIFISRSVTFIFLEALNAPPGNQSVWLVGFVALFLTLIIAIPIIVLSQKFPKYTIIEYSKTLWGPLGQLVGILYIWFFINISALTLRELGNFFATGIMPETPLFAFIISFAVLAAIAVRKGLEVIGRSGEIVGPVILVNFILLWVLIAKDINLQNLLPLIDKGWQSLFYGGFLFTTRCTELLAVTMFIPCLNRKRDISKAIIFGFGLYFLVFIFNYIAVIGLFGEEEAKALTFPFFSLTRMINVADFLERTEVIYMAIWILSTFIRTTIFYYAATLGTARLFQLKDYKPLTFPMGTIIVALSLFLFDSHAELKEFTSYKVWPLYAIPFLIYLPWGLFLTALITQKGFKKA